jgi:hypothetical protein
VRLSVINIFIVSEVLISAGVAPVLAQPYADSLKVLVVFVKFADDDVPGNPVLRSRDWPLYSDPRRLPTSARSLLSPSPDPPFADSTLTAYFHQQSMGRLVLFGDVYPQTIVSQGPEAEYHNPAGGYGKLTAEVLTAIDREGLDFSDYDYNGDGLVDHIFIILRGDSEKDSRRIAWTGASCLDARCANGPPVGPYMNPLSFDGVRIDWNLSGSIIFNRVPGNVLPHYWLVRMMAHEIGHDFWRRYFIHIPAITTNDVPAESNYNPATAAIGYVLMAGAGGGRDARGDETISAFERHLLDWIDCPALASDTDAVRLRDLYVSGDCRRIELEAAGDRRLFVSNRQRLGPFDRPRRAGVDGRFDMGLLRTTGLLVGLAQHTRYDVLPADNSLELSVGSEAYQGDLFGPGSSKQLTPWTRPTINGYTTRRIRQEVRWHALDDIRASETDRKVLIFDYVADFRKRPIIREDSWMGWETDGQVIAAPLTIMEGATLTVLTAVTLAGRVTLRPGTRLKIARGGALTLAPNAALVLATNSTLEIEGQAHIEGVVAPQAGSSIELLPTGRITRPRQTD